MNMGVAADLTYRSSVLEVLCRYGVNERFAAMMAMGAIKSIFDLTDVAGAAVTPL
jgi:hypothetical protein